MVLLMTLGALLLWETLKWVVVEAYHEWTPGASSRKIRRLRRIQEATSAAIEKELQRLQQEAESLGTQTTSISREMPQRTQRSSMTSSSTSSRERREPVEQSPRADPADSSTSRASTYTLGDQRHRSPSPARRPSVPLSSPGASSSRDVIEIPGEALRVCVDTCALMTCEHLREGLRTEGLMTSGVKEDLTRRLGARLSEVTKLPTGPTMKQLKYVLWLYRVRDLSHKHMLHYCEIVDRCRISALIDALKNR